MQYSLITTTLLAFIFPFMNHPLAMTLTIILQTLLICLIISNMSQTFWFSYILFLVFLGGMLVLFIYITSLAANEFFPSLLKIFPLLIFIIMIIFSIKPFIDSSLLNIFTFNMETQTLSFSSLTYNEPLYSLTKLYNTPTNFLTLMLVTYLFITLIAIVKITNIFLGPLRQKH
uniref:NADH-ubiquinone oxidoreductase chain 6 n=1 Tax=Ruidocollaris convexipennis TaxID=2708008 RepID=A0A6G6A7K5_9ORTH|nr:NADH dehydrogenase subunit 6 [Ruidocollaris convexipennis]QID03782.1 NADH dehydrogenase subunit 6 [Ruidocollaris convexipennis]